jgi:hypothetical protein
MTDTPDTKHAMTRLITETWASFHIRQKLELEAIERERDQLRQVIRDVHVAFPDLAEFEDKNGRSLKWLADKIEKVKGDA